MSEGEDALCGMRKATGPMIRRRTFVAGGLGALCLASLGAGVRILPAQALVRPPGAQDEQAFLGACIRCDRCRSVCPQHAIALSRMEDGFLVARTPKMQFDRGFCTTCDGEYRCAAVCPTEAIKPGFDMTVDAIGIAVINVEECLLYRGASSACSKQCAQACPYDAIAQDEQGGIAVDEGRCNGCGACELACPSTSYGATTTSGKRGISVERGQ